MRLRADIFKTFYALIAAIIVVQCGASLAFAVNAGWHEVVHHHEGNDDDDCPVVQLAHGFWDAPLTPVFAVPLSPVPPATDVPTGIRADGFRALSFPGRSGACPAGVRVAFHPAGIDFAS